MLVCLQVSVVAEAGACRGPTCNASGERYSSLIAEPSAATSASAVSLSSLTHHANTKRFAGALQALCRAVHDRACFVAKRSSSR